MYVYKETSSISEHQDDLVFLQGALEAAQEQGELSAELEAQVGVLEAHIEAGDAIEARITHARRGSRKTSARINRADRVQEAAIKRLWSDCLGAANQNKNDLRVKTLFEGGVSKLIRPALGAQNKLVEGMVRTLEAQQVYDGPLRAQHAPKLRDSVERTDALLAQREEEASALAALYADALAWKQEGNRLRTRIGALLISQGDALGVASPKEFARSFFGL